MKPWNRLLSLLGRKPGSGPRYFELDETLYTALVDLAGQEQRPTQEIQADLLAAALTQRHASDGLKQRWQSLSPREQQVSALTCLGYTNRQIAARLSVSPETVKGYVRQALVKFQLHGKDELRMLLAQWDFCAWDSPAQYGALNK